MTKIVLNFQISSYKLFFILYLVWINFLILLYYLRILHRRLFIYYEIIILATFIALFITALWLIWFLDNQFALIYLRHKIRNYLILWFILIGFIFYSILSYRGAPGLAIPGLILGTDFCNSNFFAVVCFFITLSLSNISPLRLYIT